jgi:hypothetical protein
MPGDWERFAAEIAEVGKILPAGDILRRLAGRPDPPHPRDFPTAHPRGRPKEAGPPWYGSSVNFEIEIRRYYPDLVVPEADVVPIFGCEARSTAFGPPPVSGEVCPNCRGLAAPPPPPGPDDPLPEPSPFYCERCSGSGYDVPLSEQLRLAGVPSGTAKAAPPGVRPRPRGRRKRRLR